MKKSKLALLAIALLMGANVKAQLKFKNSETTPIEVAIAYYVSTNDFTGWYSEGWFRIEPGETKTLIPKIAYDFYYFYAKDDKDREWVGGGKYKFVVNSKLAFNIKNANMDYQAAYLEHKVFKNFKRINVSDAIGKTYTMLLTEEED